MRMPKDHSRAQKTGQGLLWATLMLSAAWTAPLGAMAAPMAADDVYGPYNAAFLAGGDGLTKPLRDATLSATGPWTLSTWFQADDVAGGIVLLAGVGDPAQGRYLALKDGRLALRTGSSETISGGSAVKAGTWHHALASSDGKTARLYLDGAEVAHGIPAQVNVTPVVSLAPRLGGAFAGRIAGFTVTPQALGAVEAKAAAQGKPAADLINFEAASPTWPVQVRQMMGQVTPQDPWTLPKSTAPFSKPVAKPLPTGPALKPDGADNWTVGGWRLAEAPKVQGDGARISQPGFDTASWYVATVPGTVLTTLVDRGVYPDPDYGLDNLAIPESLNRQDYWYRTEFDAPADLQGRHPLLTFKGINYAAEVWLNGERLGSVRGAFIRGQFDVTGPLRPGQKNVLAVKITPPPHPGLPHEQSIAAGVGENGGMQALDGPTFIASEGWDWIPAVRDRNTGLWQDVTLTATGAVRIGDSQVVTKLPLPDTSKAEITITVPVENLTGQPVQAEIRAAFDDVTVAKTVTLAPGAGNVTLTPAEFPQLRVRNPTLWWPNGLGDPALHNLTLTAAVGGAQGSMKSDEKHTRFGIREVSYELSLMDSGGHLRRVEVDPTAAFQRGERVIDGSHTGIHKIAGGWVSSLVPGAEKSPAVKPLEDASLAPYLILKVNGVRVPARGGSWGTDDWRKRVSRDRLEPFFRLHREAHVNIIRNWVGQNTEDVFFDLADEYGLMVLNDFWESTQDYNIEAQDVPLFLDNAADVIRRYRNHPSIVLWFGRNEGVPQPVLNEGLESLVATLDGTRYYSGSSNRVNLQDSGPYDYRDPSQYFTTLSRGFAVEVGTPSFPTLEAFEAAVPAADRWPVSDTWAYHDWHQTGNGDTHGFMAAMDRKLGAATSLADFERKAQLMNYESHRAIFEGMNAGLWTVNSGRLLWMTQPAWPSTNWQIMSHDYDTHGAFYGLQKAAEPLHVQLNAPDDGISVVNNTREAKKGLTIRARVLTVAGQVISDQTQKVDAQADAATPARKLDLAAAIQANGLVLVELELSDATGTLSQNVYWRAADEAATRRLNDLAPQPVTLATRTERAGDEVKVHVTLTNTGTAASLMNKLTLQNADGSRLLPAYASDNYVSLLPGDRREVTIAYPAALAQGQPKVGLRGWNTQPATAAVTVP
ncbi:glycosyl hydrolase 2 galactose-binding domain-containing protein [Nitrospirillum bahiense]|uniref:Glycosyl hydrolase family 2 n=1 Tax=Nitrospirillum amazonense TaxID=28077 RepID=A0A560G7C2_9PROT|nr:LamG-like jellyroll fold domain-containing protein [Nitrospirillum amazonense]TWB29724.1 glycosyl hydrolase family 2 [Nitrospirillum amazonense]